MQAQINAKCEEDSKISAKGDARKPKVTDEWSV